MLAFIEFLRAIATVLIANSHFKGVYPNDIFSFGGGFGLALFYMISGYLLANIKADTSFWPWYGKRLIRLYVPLWLVRAAELIIWSGSIKSVKGFVFSFIFPGTWFGASIAIIYVIYFFTVKYLCLRRGTKPVYIICVVMALCYYAMFIFRPQFSLFSIQTLTFADAFSVETPYAITQTVWVICIFTGYAIRKREKSPSGRDALWAGAVVACVGAFAAIRLFNGSGEREWLEALLLPDYVLFATSMFMLFLPHEAGLSKAIATVPGKAVKLVSACSLEIYYIQFWFINNFKQLQFPVNLLLICIGITITAYIIHIASKTIIKASGNIRSRLSTVKRKHEDNSD